MTLVRQRWVALLLVALAARSLTFGNPIVHADEQFYFVVARAMWHGQLPYIDIWDRKPLGLFLLYMPAAALPLPWGTLAYQALALACVVATAGLVARFAERAGWTKGALAGGAAYILWLDLLNGSSGQAPVFYNLPVALAAWLVATRPGERRAGYAAMALVGLALQIKPAAVFEGMFLGLWLLADMRRARLGGPALTAYAIALVALALLPTAAAYGFYAACGAGPAWWQANVTAVLGRLPDPLPTQIDKGLKLLLVLSPLIAMGFGAMRRDGPSEPDIRRMRLFLRAWFLASLGGIVLFGGWHDHYGLPALAPGAACAAAFMGGAGRRFAGPILILAAITGQVTLAIRRITVGDGGEVAAVARAIGPGRGALFVYSGEPLLYAETDRPVVSRFLFPSHLYLAREDGSIGVRQTAELRRILSRQPEVIVVAPPYKLEQPHIRFMVEAALARDYRLTDRLPVGTQSYAVYKRQAARRRTISPS